MKDKKGLPTQSQTLGILWISAALLLLAAVIFFSHRKDAPDAETDTLQQQNERFEDRKQYPKYTNSRNNKSHNTIKQNKAYSPTHHDTTLATRTAPAPRRQPLVVELNTADTLTLQLLHGIGPTYARRIVKYRERLGGFISPTQLLEVYGITPELLASLRSDIIVDTAHVSRLPVNQLELKQLIRHPYIEYYQARDIVRLRQKGIVFRSADDLRAVPSMADSTLERLLPYIDFTLPSDQ